MKMEDQVVSLGFAKELKALGVKQDSVWFWNTYITSKPYLSRGNPFEDILAADGTYIQYSVSAYTAAELGEMLPNNDNDKEYDEYVTLKMGGGEWIAWEIQKGLFDREGHYLIAKTEADARAKMLIYLIREGIIMAGNIK